jgi:pentatricopeptide repeat protein
MAERDLIRKDVYIATALVVAFAKFGKMEEARNIFEQIEVRNVVAWTALISGYAECGLGHDALKCFRQMRNEGIHPNAVTYVCASKACSIVGSVKTGEYIYAEVKEQRLLQTDIVLGTALVDMFSKCGSMEKAQEVFDELPMRNIVSWTVLIAGYVARELINEAVKCFKQMQDEGISPNGVTYACLLKCHGIAQSREIIQHIKADVQKQGLLQTDLVLGNSLIVMYAKCGALNEAQKNVFEQLPVRDVMSWTSLIDGYGEHGFAEQALGLFRKMRDNGICPSVITYICMLKICGSLGSLEVGEDIDSEVRKQGLLDRDIVLGTALVGMYAKCGALKKAQTVFEELPMHNVISWTSLMTGYAQLGQPNDVYELYRRMRTENVAPNSITFTVLLTAFSHGGLLEEGKKLLHEMCFVYNLPPVLEHYASMMDLFGRAGCFDKAEELLENVPSQERLPLFLAILGACRKWNNVKLGRWAFEQVGI